MYVENVWLMEPPPERSLFKEIGIGRDGFWKIVNVKRKKKWGEWVTVRSLTVRVIKARVISFIRWSVPFALMVMICKESGLGTMFGFVLILIEMEMRKAETIEPVKVVINGDQDWVKNVLGPIIKKAALADRMAQCLRILAPRAYLYPEKEDPVYKILAEYDAIREKGKNNE